MPVPSPYSARVPNCWTAVTVIADAELADSLGAFLIDHGAPGLVSEDVANGVRLTAHFEHEAPRAELAAFCARLGEWFPGSAPVQVSFATTTAENWADNWKEHFPPLAIGERLWVHPPWMTDIPVGRSAVVIDPGMAFGTGHHASTRGCLTFLERSVAPEMSQRVLDIGTGSGVLAIAAVALGAREAWGVDTDADACAIATANATVNAVASSVHIRNDLADVSGVFDIVLANLFAGQLIEMAALIRDHLRPGGMAIGAGILVTEADAVVRAWKAVGLVVQSTLDEMEWTTIMALKDA
jgi:ribosomal protein L11 methyltransferase